MFGAFGGSAECPELPSYRFYRMEQAAASSHERPQQLIETITMSRVNEYIVRITQAP